MPNLFFDLQQRCSVKKSVPKNFANSTGKYLCWNLLSLKSQALQALQLYQKDSPTQVFSCEICKTFKNTCFVEHLPAAASGSWKHSFWTCCKTKDVDSKEFFRKMKLTTLPPLSSKKKALLKGWKYLSRIVLGFFKNCQGCINIKKKSLKDVVRRSWI